MNTQDLTLVRYDAACRALAAARAVDEVKEIRNVAEAMRACAKQAKNRGLEIDAAEIRIRAERRIGELIGAQRESVGLAKAGRPKIGSEPDPISKPATLEEAGIDKHLADRARKLEALPAQTFEDKLAAWRDKSMAEAERVRVDILAPIVLVSLNSGNNEWYTPAEIIEPARKVLGGIDLDPASCEAANRVVKATWIFTESDDGLTQPWSGRVWMNPPYAQPLIAQFCKKLAAEVQSGSVSAAIVLTNNGTETQWFRTLWDIAAVGCFPSGRVRCWQPEKEKASASSPTQGDAVFYIGPKPATFQAMFGDLGLVFWTKP